MLVPVLMLVWVLLLVLYLLRYRDHPADRFCPEAAWLRAGMYWCFCLLLGVATGALDAVLNDPLVWPGQLADWRWWLSTVLVFGFILAAYWGYWYRTTLRFGRPLQPLPQLLFGLVWGVSSGVLFLSYWEIALGLTGEWPLWVSGLLAYGMISVWQALWMDMYWDVYVSPEHDTPESIRAKVPRTHVPNMTLCLPWFVVYQNHGLFVATQTIALLAASFGMRMPAPWNGHDTPPARRVPGLWGIPRAGGYIDKSDQQSPEASS